MALILGYLILSLTNKGDEMTIYKNLGGNSGVSSYEIDSDSITVQFNDGSVYLYNHTVTGKENVEIMKDLARSGSGLNSFINTKVRKRYASKLR